MTSAASPDPVSSPDEHDAIRDAPTPYQFQNPVLEDQRIGPPTTLRFLAGIAALGFALTFAGGVLFTVGVSKTAAAVLVIVGLTLSFAMGLAAAAEQHRRQKLLRLADELERRGLTAHFRIKRRPRPEFAAAFTPFRTASDLRGGAASAQWIASRFDGAEADHITLLSHLHVKSDGRTTQVYRHVGAAVRVPAAWPGLRVATKTLGDRVGGAFGGAFGGKSIRLDEDTFNQRFRVDSRDENFALMTLTPEIQRWLAESSPSFEAWHIGGGWLVALSRAKPNLREVLLLAERATTLRSMIEPVVFEYVSETDARA